MRKLLVILSILSIHIALTQNPPPPLPIPEIVPQPVILTQEAQVEEARVLPPVNIVTADWSPYTDSDAVNQGFASEIIEAAFSKAAFPTPVAFLDTWSRVSLDLDEARILSFPWYFNAERSAKWYFSDPIIFSRQALMVPVDSDIRIRQMTDLEPYWIGTTQEYSYGETFDGLKPQLNIDEANSDITNIKKVIRGRVDAFVVEPFVGASLLSDFSQEDQAKVKLILDTPFEANSLHLVCAQDMPDCLLYLETFNAGLALMQADGSLQAIINKALTTN